MTEPQTLEIRIHGENLPGITSGPHTQVRVGIQKKEEVEQDVPGDAEDAAFTAILQVKRDGNDDRPVFSGPYAFGTPKERFLYLSWGVREGEAWQMFARTKIPLNGLGWDAIMKALDTAQPVELVVNLTSEKGGPITGSLKDRHMRWTG